MTPPAPTPGRRRVTTKPTEATMHMQICGYIRLNYPEVIFRSDYASGLKLSRYQAAMNKQLSSSRGYPDLFIAEPRGQYAGMFLELKREGTIVWLKTGKLTTNPHIQEQAKVIQDLLDRGYKADFAVGYDDAVLKINAYMMLPLVISSRPSRGQPADSGAPATSD